jgi:hypothetical protein
MRTENRAIRPVAGLTKQVNSQNKIKLIKNIYILLTAKRSGQLPFLGSSRTARPWRINRSTRLRMVKSHAD